MKPLSTISYFRHNKRKLLSNLVIIIVSICLVYIMECFIASIVQSIYPLDATRFQYCSVLVSTEAVPSVPSDIVESLENSEHTETVVPVVVKQFVFSVPGSTTHTAVFSVEDKNQSYINDKFNIKLRSGRMPTSGEDEITLDENVAKNNNLSIGSKTKIDKSYNLDRSYTVVGIIKSDSHISFVGSPGVNGKNTNYNERGYLIFPKQGHHASSEKDVTSYSSKGLTVWTLSLYNKLFEKNSQTFQILDAMVVLAIIVMVVCLACSKYAQYFSRKKEIGTLSALGYTQDEIIKRLTREVVFTNILGFILGLALAIVLSKSFLVSYFESVGGSGVYLYVKAAIMALLAPTATTIFTLIPVCRLIRRVDAISIVESN